MKILIMGPPASGKGTIGEMLAKKLNLPLVSTGQLLRDVSESDLRYDEINTPMDNGELVPHHITANVLKERLSKPDCDDGYILDGWMRGLQQKDYFEPDLNAVLFINISPETSIKRISGRRICEKDGFTCNIYTLPPKHPDNCDDCNGPLIQRDDDKEDVVKERLEVYEKETIPVVEYYKNKDLLAEIDGEGTPDQVFKLALNALNLSEPN